MRKRKGRHSGVGLQSVSSGLYLTPEAVGLRAKTGLAVGGIWQVHYPLRSHGSASSIASYVTAQASSEL